MRTCLIALVGLAAGAAAIAAAPMSPQRPDPLADERAVIRAADTLDHAVDTKDWDAARRILAERVVLDVGSIGGPAGVEIAGAEIVAGWRRAFQGDKTSLHLRTNHIAAIDGDRAVLTSHGYAWNRLPAGALPGHDGPVMWEVWGIYEQRFVRTAEGWRMTHFRFDAMAERGPREVATTIRPEN